MVEIIRIRPGESLADEPYYPFEIKLEKPRDQYLHAEILALLREESERILKIDRRQVFDSVAFSLDGAPVPIETLAGYIIINNFRLQYISWEGKHDSHVPNNGRTVESTGSANQTLECLTDVHKMQNRHITIKQAEICARDLVDIYHARYCTSKCDDFEHCNALLPRKNSEGRKRTDLEISVLAECDKKIERDIENIAKRSDACVGKLLEVVENHRRLRMSYKLSSDSCEKWYRRVGIYIERVLRSSRAYGSIDAQKESELLQLYPKGWFECHVFRHLEEIHTENRGSAPEDVINTSGRNDTNMITELEARNLYNSHRVSKAIQCLHDRNKKHEQEIRSKDLQRFKEGAETQRQNKKLQRLNEELQMENEKLRNGMSEQYQTDDLNGPQSSRGKNIQEMVRQQIPQPIQNVEQSKYHPERKEKENKYDAPKKGPSKVTKTRPKRVHGGGNENIYLKEYRYTKRR
jgi:hypothetical protein